jgi:hypothetical protein
MQKLSTRKLNSIKERLIETHGMFPSINAVNPMELLKLRQDSIPVDQIAEIFGTTKIAVQEKLDRIDNITAFLKEVQYNKKYNDKAKQAIWDTKNIDKIAKAITHYIFRNGPVEDMHADPDSQLSDKDMKILNKYMVNRLAYIFKLLIEERWTEFYGVVKPYYQYGAGWDKPDPSEAEEENLNYMIQELLWMDSKRKAQ